MNKSESIIIESPTSFTGATKRIWRVSDSTAYRLVAAFLILPTVYVFIIFWYVIIFGLFGIFVIPFRLLTRSNRKQKKADAQHRELLEALSKSKQ